MQKQQHNNTPKRATKGNRRQQRPASKANIPFKRKKRNIGEWSYEHRAGLCITLIAYLLLGILFVGAKIKINTQSAHSAILIDFPDEREFEFTPEQLEMLEMLEYMGYDDFGDVANVASNEGVDFGELQRGLDARLRDDRGTQAEEIYGSAGELDAQMEANRQAYEEGLAQTQAMIDAHKARRGGSGASGGNKGDSQGAQRGSESSDGDKEDVQVKGRVTVSYSFLNPTRTRQNLVVPAYRCEGGGQVTVIAHLDSNGYVVSAEIDRSASAGDGCMQRTAIDAAKASRFNLDSSAPNPHRGTITYIFIPQ